MSKGSGACRGSARCPRQEDAPVSRSHHGSLQARTGHSSASAGGPLRCLKQLAETPLRPGLGTAGVTTKAGGGSTASAAPAAPPVGDTILPSQRRRASGAQRCRRPALPGEGRAGDAAVLTRGSEGKSHRHRPSLRTTADTRVRASPRYLLGEASAAPPAFSREESASPPLPWGGTGSRKVVSVMAVGGGLVQSVKP